MKEHSALLGIKKPVLLHISNFAASPLTIGFWKPFILIPLASINQLTANQMEAVLLHELAHIRRNDYLVNIVLQLAEITLFFNPFMRLLLKQARLERENSCDDYVLQFQYNATDYAKALLAIEQHSVGSILALGTNNQNEFQLLNRIKRMLAPERRAFNYRQQLGLLFLITLLGLGFTVILPKQQNTTSVAGTQKIINAKTNSFTPVENLLPPAIDLVKNLEDIRQQFKQPTSAQQKDKARKMEASITNATTELEKKMKPHIREMEASAREIAKLYNGKTFNADALQMSALKLQELSNADWSKVIAPALNESVKVYAFPEIFTREKWPEVVYSTVPPAALAAPRAKMKQQMAEANREQLRQVARLQSKISNEQKELLRLTEMAQHITDSLRFSFSEGKPALAYTESSERARKQAAIAPFRQRDVPTTYGPAPIIENYQFNFSNKNTGNGANGEEDDEDDQPNNEVKVYHVDRDNNSFNNGECAKEKRRVKTVTILNGKAFSEMVKKVWADANDQKDKGWTDEMQQKVVNEIGKELKNLEHVEIKTHVSTEGDNNNKTIIIEIDAN